jgi:hypothetical protein
VRGVVQAILEGGDPRFPNYRHSSPPRASDRRVDSAERPTFRGSNSNDLSGIPFEEAHSAVLTGHGFFGAFLSMTIFMRRTV